MNIHSSSLERSCHTYRGCPSVTVHEDRDLRKIPAQPHTTLCIQFLNRENNDKNNTLPLGKHICLTIVWGCAKFYRDLNTVLRTKCKARCKYEITICV